MFEKGPIRTQVCVYMDRPDKQENDGRKIHVCMKQLVKQVMFNNYNLYLNLARSRLITLPM